MIAIFSNFSVVDTPSAHTSTPRLASFHATDLAAQSKAKLVSAVLLAQAHSLVSDEKLPVPSRLPPTRKFLFFQVASVPPPPMKREGPCDAPAPASYGALRSRAWAPGERGLRGLGFSLLLVSRTPHAHPNPHNDLKHAHPESPPDVFVNLLSIPFSARAPLLPAQAANPIKPTRSDRSLPTKWCQTPTVAANLATKVHLPPSSLSLSLCTSSNLTPPPAPAPALLQTACVVAFGSNQSWPSC